MRTHASLVLLIVAMAWACHKKSDNPAPSQPNVQQVQSQPAVQPYYPRIRTERNECCPVLNNGSEQYERFKGHNDTHSPKADVWQITEISRDQYANKDDTLYVKNVLIWWVGNQPYSDQFVFRWSTTRNVWERTWADQVNMNNNSWLDYNPL